MVRKLLFPIPLLNELYAYEILLCLKLQNFVDNYTNFTVLVNLIAGQISKHRHLSSIKWDLRFKWKLFLLIYQITGNFVGADSFQHRL